MKISFWLLAISFFLAGCSTVNQSGNSTPTVQIIETATSSSIPAPQNPSNEKPDTATVSPENVTITQSQSELATPSIDLPCPPTEGAFTPFMVLPVIDDLTIRTQPDSQSIAASIFDDWRPMLAIGITQDLNWVCVQTADDVFGWAFREELSPTNGESFESLLIID